MKPNLALEIEVRTLEEIVKGLVREDIKDVTYPPRDERRYTERGLIMMGLSSSAEGAE